MASPVKPLRTVVWSTGGVGTIAIDAIRRRPDLELVGVWVHSSEKDGRDVGELTGGGAIGLTATNDAAALIALEPDCVVYAASGPNVTPVRCRITSGYWRRVSTSCRRRPPASCTRRRTTHRTGWSAGGGGQSG